MDTFNLILTIIVITGSIVFFVAVVNLAIDYVMLHDKHTATVKAARSLLLSLELHQDKELQDKHIRKLSSLL